MVRWDAASGRSTGSQGLALTTSSADEELEEGRDTGETSADGYWRRFTPREADAMSEREDISEEETWSGAFWSWPKKWRSVR